MELLQAVQDGEPALVVGEELTPAERADSYALTSPAAMLLGQIGIVLRTFMFDQPTGWVDVWQRSNRRARMEWSNGPEVRVVASRLASKEHDGFISGVPGLRLLTCTEHTATLVWYGGAEPVELYLTRLIDSNEEQAPLASLIAAAWTTTPAKAV
ncbi:MAG: hypothetical protein QOH84_1530 [Kribbellaceae bacterium]|jgi:hypothetical protein|nr:hypothetical protein [Kribbellaceae bacterium]